MVLDTIIEDLKRDEGLRLKPYRCPAGKRTIGIGRNFDDNPITPAELEHILAKCEITENDAEMLLRNDLEKTLHKLRTLFREFDSFPDNVQRVLVNMHFNLGHAGFLSLRTLIKGVNEKNWKHCAERMRTFAWRKQVGKRAERLIALMQEA